jgi:GxxExxY protein
MDINDLTYMIRGCIFNVYNKLGPGLLESVYEQALMIELRKAGIKANNQVPVDIVYDGQKLEHDFRLDILVNDAIILELKSVEALKPVHFKQLQTYLKLADKRLGLLINFNENNIRNGIHRIANKL